MKLEDFPGLAELSRKDKLLLASELIGAVGFIEDGDLDNLPSESDELVSQDVRDELDARWARYEADPSSALTLEEVIERIKFPGQ